MRRLLAMVLCSVAGPLWAANGVKPLPAPVPLPFAGIYQPQGVDEIGLWREGDEEERLLANSPKVIRDAALNAYVNGVLCATVGADRCKAARVYILRVPLFNASMSPNGTMRVFSGLLLRTRSEAELGAVLGHEFGHFEKRHSLNQFKAKRTGTDLLSWAALMTSMSGSRIGYQTFNNIEFSVYGRLAKFGRDQEREADILGLGYLNAGPLRPQAASRVWRNQIREVEASAAARGLSKPDFNHNSFFASHPSDGERADYLFSLAAPEDDASDEGAERYAVALSPWMSSFLDDQIALNDFGGSEFVINRLAESGWTAELWRARGDLFRNRGNPRDLMNAADFYAKAVAINPNLASAYRGLGLSLLKTGRASDGRAALKRYLQLKPDASDAPMIRMTISSSGGDQ